MELDERSRAAARPALADLESESDSSHLAELPLLLRKVSAGSAEMLSKSGPLLEFFDKEGEINAALKELEWHREEFEQFAADTQANMRQSDALFAEERFAALRFSAADVQRAFDQVGQPANASWEDENVLKVRAAIVHMADEDYRTLASIKLVLQIPVLVAVGRYLDARLVQECAERTAGAEGESNPFLFAMFSRGYEAWLAERRAERDQRLQKLGLIS